MKLISGVMTVMSLMMLTACNEVTESSSDLTTSNESLALRRHKGKQTEPVQSATPTSVESTPIEGGVTEIPTPPPTPLNICADYNLDGVVNAADDQYLLGLFESVGVIGMDVNNDGADDVQDLALAIEFRRSLTSSIPDPQYCPSTTNCWTANSTYQNQEIQVSSTRMEVKFKATPSAQGMDGVLMLSNRIVSNYPEAGIRTRFSQANIIQARNGDALGYGALQNFSYVANTAYEFRFDVDLADQSYDLYVKPNGQNEVQVADDYEISVSMNSITHLSFVANGGTMQICDLSSRAIATQNPPTAPLAPSNLSLSRPSGSNQILLSWSDNSTNETGFQIERTIAGGSPSQLSVSANATTYTDSISSNGNYTYKVRSVNAVGASNYTSTQSIMIGSTEPPAESLSLLPQDAEGFTIMNPSSDSRMIFVGTAADVPQAVRDNFADRPNQIMTVSSVAAGLSLMRAGYPDQLHIKRGQVFNQALGNLDALRGRNSNERAVIKAYGDSSLARPTFSGSSSIESCIKVNTRAEPKFLLIADIACQNFSTAGVLWNGRGNDIHFENLQLTGSYQNMVFFPVHDSTMTGRVLTNLVVRRSYLSGARGARGQGFYMSSQHDSSQSPPVEPIHIRGVLLEENVIYDNGTAGSTQAHNVYVGAGVREIVFHNNMALNGASHGLLSRAAGDMLNNLSAKNGIGMQWGSGGLAQDEDCCDPKPSEPLTGTVEDNIILDGQHVGERASIGAQIFWIAGGGDFRRNIFTTDRSTRNYTLGVSLSRIGSQPAQINDVNFENNIFYNWNAGFTFNCVSMSGLRLMNNKFYDSDVPTTFEGSVNQDGITLNSSMISGSGNQADVPSGRTMTNISTSLIGLQRATLSFSSPTRSIESYQQSITGSADYAAFIAKLRSMDRTRWDSRYSAARINAYVRAGFDMPSPRD